MNTALKSGPEEGRKWVLGRVPTALRAWATSGHCPGPNGGSFPRASLKGGSMEVAFGAGGLPTQPPPTPSLGPDSHKAAAGVSGLKLKPGPAGAHTCPPRAAHALGEAPGAGMLSLLPEALSTRPTGGRGPAVGIRTWCTRKRKNLGLNWDGEAHPRADQDTTQELRYL